MSKRREEAIRLEMIAVLDAIELGLEEFGRIFHEVEHGTALDPRRSHHLAAQCGDLLRHIIETRNAIRLSASSAGIH